MFPPYYVNAKDGPLFPPVYWNAPYTPWLPAWGEAWKWCREVKR